jgi:hypothetical protein
MNTLKNKTYSVLVIALVLLLFVSGCQQKPKVVSEKNLYCCVGGDKVLNDPTTVQDPELGEMAVGQVYTWRYTCDDPAFDNTYVAIQDWYKVDNTDRVHSMIELIQDDGGVWRGGCDFTSEKTATCQFEGLGKAQGLLRVDELDFSEWAKYYCTKSKTTITEEPVE